MPEPTEADFKMSVTDADPVVLRIQEECGVDFGNDATRAIAAVAIVRACAKAHAEERAAVRAEVQGCLGECRAIRLESEVLEASLARVEALMGDSDG